MKEIIDLEGKEYLAKTYKLAKAYKQCIVDTGAVAAATQPAQLTGNETPEEKAKKIAEQGAKNAEEMMRMIYEEHADMTERSCRFLWRWMRVKSFRLPESWPQQCPARCLMTISWLF